MQMIKNQNSNIELVPKRVIQMLEAKQHQEDAKENDYKYKPGGMLIQTRKREEVATLTNEEQSSIKLKIAKYLPKIANGCSHVGR